MPTRLKLDTPLPSRTYTYRGITVEIDGNAAFAQMNKLREEQTKAAGVDWFKLSEDDQNRWTGKASVNTLILGIEPFTINDYAFQFDAPSELDMYETMGEELLGENPDLMSAIITNIAVTQKPDYEISGN